MKAPVSVVITGAAGQIAYSLIFKIAHGEMFGPEQPVRLVLLDIPPMEQTLKGVEMEIRDCASALVAAVALFTSPEHAFDGADFVCLVGAMPRKEGMERKDLLKANAGIFKEQGRYIDQCAKKTVKIVVVGNPANTNCSIAMENAPSIPKENFSALTRLDHNRAKSFIAGFTGVNPADVHDVFIWGNHSSTQYPDVNHGFVIKDGGKVSVKHAVANDELLHGQFIKDVQQRGAAVIAARKLSSAASAAQAIVDHVHDWVFGTGSEIVSMAIYSRGEYGITPGICYSFPVRITADGVVKVVEGLNIDEFSRAKMDASLAELADEKNQAFEFLH